MNAPNAPATKVPTTKFIQAKMPDQDLSLGRISGVQDVASGGSLISYDGTFWSLAPGFYRLVFHGQFFNFPDPEGSIVVGWVDDSGATLDQFEVRPDSSTAANESSGSVLDVLYQAVTATRVHLGVQGAQPLLGPKIVPNAIGYVESIP